MTEQRIPTPAGRVPKQWRDELVLALRLRDVSGARIGEVLAEVEEFCTDSDLDAPTAFGDPRTYAASLAPTAGSPRLRDDLRAVGEVIVGFLGLVIVVAAAGGAGDELVVTAGWLLGLPIMLAAAIITLRAVGRAVEKGGWRASVGPFAVIALTLAAVVGLLLVLDTPVATVPDPLALAIGAALLIGDAVAGTVRARRRPTSDLVTSPGADPADTRRRNVRSDVIVAWMMPAFALVGVALLAMMDALLG